MTSTRPLSRGDMLRTLRKAGVVGTSTGIPLHTKLADPGPMLVINAVEGEPSYTVMTLLMERSARELADGIRALRDFGFRRAVVAVNDWTLEESDALAARADDAGFELAEIEGDFRAEGEAGIVAAALHKPLEVASVGVTVVSLETVWHAQRALFRNRPQVTKLVQMAGALETAHVFEAPIGVATADVARVAGAAEGMRAVGLTAAERMAGVRELPTSPSIGVTKTTDMILVLDPEIPGPPELALEIMAPADGIRELADFGRARVPFQLFSGHPQSPVVKVGQRVRRGEPIAESREDGVDLHSPFDGEVAVVERDAIEIARL